MPPARTFSWILDSGGAGRGAWQGGVIHQLMRWTSQNGGYPTVSMGASAGGYAAADVATETEATVLKGWTCWGQQAMPPAGQVPAQHKSFFQRLARWAQTDKSLILCCDPGGRLWETSSRLRLLNTHPSIQQAMHEKRLLVIYPDHRVEASFLCHNNPVIMRTFRRGQEQGDRLLKSEAFQRFIET
jgi:hypothetical protein